MVAVAGGLELERGVLDGDSMMLGNAALQLVQNLGRMPVAEAAVVDDDVRGEHR